MKKRERWFGPLWRALVGIAIIGACSGRAKDFTVAGGDSESHFLSHCVPGSCEAGLECLFGICTELCASDADCSRWSAASVCRPVDAGAPASAVCDMECSADADCSRVGTGLTCDAGRCRTASDKARSVGFSCNGDEGCGPGLRCDSNQCTSRCTGDADCPDGTDCEPFGYLTEPGATSCVLPCTDPAPVEGSHAECAMLGPGGRCFGGRCVEMLTGQCGDVGQPDAEWACYEDLAADLFRERHPALLDQTLCLPTTNGRYGDVRFVQCADPGCGDAGGRCAVNGLVLETTAMPLQVPNGTETIVMQAVGELRLSEPVRLPLELEGPAERCEYSVDARFWGLQFFDTISYVPSYAAQAILEQSLLDGNGSPPEFSQQAIDGGFAQPVRSIGFGHTGSRYSAPIAVEDSEATVTLVSGGSRCEEIQVLVGIELRVTLADLLNTALYDWFAAQRASLECTVCGTLGCELACRRR